MSDYPVLKPMQAATAVIVAQEEGADAKESLAVVEAMQIANAEDFELAVQMTAEIKTQRNRIDSLRKSFVGPLNEVVAKINAFFKPPIAAYESAECLLKARMLAYTKHAEAERERLLQEAEQQAQDGDLGQAEVAIQEAEAVRVPEVAGFGVRKSWTGEVVDASKIPRQYLVPDVAKLVSETRAKKGAIKIPGWHPFETETAAISRRK